MANGRPLQSLADLAGHTLLHDDSPDNDPSCPGWDHWLCAAGHTEIDASRGPRFNQASLVLESAVLGRGVALAKSALAEADIRAGRLVRLFSTEVPVNFAYYLLAPKAKLNLPKVSFFRDWLFSQVQEVEGQNWSVTEMTEAPSERPCLLLQQPFFLTCSAVVQGPHAVFDVPGADHVRYQ